METKKALNLEEADKLFGFCHHSNHGRMQWKGTDICMDFICECGYNNHYDGDFAHVVECAGCGTQYALNPHIEMVKLENKTTQYLESVV